MTATMPDPTEVKRLQGKFAAVRELVIYAKGDGWVTAGQIRLVGGSEGLRRLRDLRDHGYIIEKRHIGNGMYEYRAL